MSGGRWFEDWSSAEEVHRHRLRRVLHRSRSEFQDIRIVDLAVYGRTLALDGRVQASERDEFIYHESLVQPAMALFGAPRRVLILGGGEGATAREALRWPSVEACTMVDLDGAVVAACRKHLPSFHQGAFEDPRLTLRIEDALRFVARDRRRWDVIVSDTTEPAERGPAAEIFTVEFFRKLRARLGPGGVLAIQAGPAALAEARLFASAVKTLARAFPRVHPYVAAIPSFSGLWGFAVCGGEGLDARPTGAGVDARLRKAGVAGLRCYDGAAHAGMFNLPLYLREAIAGEKRVYTRKRLATAPSRGK